MIRGSPYDAFVVGGALYTMRWHRDARRFVRRYRGGTGGPSRRLHGRKMAGDFRDRDQIATWARSIAASLDPVTTS